MRWKISDYVTLHYKQQLTAWDIMKCNIHTQSMQFSGCWKIANDEKQPKLAVYMQLSINWKLEPKETLLFR